MSDKKSKVNKILVVLVSLLIVVVAVQFFFLFMPHTWISEVLHRNTPALKNPVGASVALAAPLNSKAPSANDKWFNDQFDPNEWNPFEEMQQMQQQMDHMFANAYGHFNMSPNFQGIVQGEAFAPNLDVEEDANQYVVRVDLPGMEKANMDVQVEDNTLTIKGKREETIERNDQNGKIEVQERRMGRFERSIELPGAVDDAHMQTAYKDGILTITLPKAK